MTIWKWDFIPKGLYYLGLHLMAGNKKFKLYWFNYVKVFFFPLNTKSGGRKSMTSVMLPSGIQAPAFQISIRHQVCHLMVSKWLLKLQHHIQVPGRNNQVGRTRQKGQNTMCKLRLHPLKSFLGCLTQLTSPYPSLTSLVLHGSPCMREAMCITTTNKTWILLKERRD